jgi:two-component system, OmpR family, KDP operon response regulator KdpE
MRVCLRSSPAQAPEGDRLDLGRLHIDLAARDVRLHGRRVKLTPKEYDLLVLFVRNSGKILTHRFLLTNIWGPAHVGDVAYLRVFIRQLRAKLEALPETPQIIVTEPGVGYRAIDARQDR